MDWLKLIAVGGLYIALFGVIMLVGKIGRAGCEKEQDGVDC